ncbi:MAG: hypothetical protein QOF09_1455 [Alphaproteobacteria bacterium]|jgi:hypothetical protein|nr:hypothetical protein [Alphaproteobacteria bacterium]
MLDTITLIGAVFGVLAVLYGLLSRNFGTAFVAGFFVGLIHAGLVALAVVQSGAGVAALPFSHTVGELLTRSHQVPLLGDGLDLVAQSPYATPPAQLAAYLFAGALVLMLTLVVLYLVKWALAGLISAAIPKKA